jgi:4-carboxymuconolactone decarboxylase
MGKTTSTTIIAMTGENDTLGGRLPLADPTTLTGAQRELFDTMMTTWVPWANDAGFQSTTVDGRFIGPFNPLLLRPAVASQFLDLQFAEQSHTSLSERVRQAVILAVGAAWGADYELYAHSAVARKAGISEDAIRTLADGGLPDDLGEHEKIAACVARQLSTSHRIDDGLYREAEQAFGKEGLFDVVILIGIYHMVCGMLTMFGVPAPAQGTGAVRPRKASTMSAR